MTEEQLKRVTKEICRKQLGTCGGCPFKKPYGVCTEPDARKLIVQEWNKLYGDKVSE